MPKFQPKNAAPLKLPGMAIEMWPVDKPVDYPKNARKWTDQAIAKVAASIREYGFRQPIVVDADGVIVIGHLRRRAAQSLGLAEVPVHVASDLSPKQIKGLRLMDNRSNQEASWDQMLLGSEMMDLKGFDLDLKLTGFAKDEINSMFVFDDGWPAAEKTVERLEPGAMPEEDSNAMPQERGLQFRVIVDCIDEAHQTELLDRFKQEELKCRALIS